MNRGHDTSIYYYFIIVKMAASTVEMTAAVVILFHLPCFLIGDETGNHRVPKIENKDDVGNPVTISPPGAPNLFPPLTIKIRINGAFGQNYISPSVF